MRILLATINLKRLFTPLALLYLKACLLADKSIEEQTEVEIREFSLYDSDDFILQQIEKSKPELIGFSCYVWNIKRILDISSKLKGILKNPKIILGGPQASPLARVLLKQNPQVDAVVKGEGEITFVRVVRSFLNREISFKDISGLTYRHAGRIIDNSPRPPVADLDSIPSAYMQQFIPLRDKEACLETQRGCVFKCHFCYYHKSFKKVRFFSMQRVREELLFLLSQKLNSIYLMDPVFNLDIKRAKDICQFIIENNKNNIPFHVEIRAELMDAELAELFHKANIKYIEVGLQSAEKRVLSAINRRLNSQRFMRGIKLLNKFGANTEVQLILGLPRERKQSFLNSLAFAINLEPKRLIVARLQVLPGTYLWHKAKRLGIIYEKDPPYYFLKSRSLRFDELIELEKVINSVSLFRESKTIKFLCQEARIKLLDLIKLWLGWLEDSSFLLARRNSNLLKKQLRGFIKYFCRINNIDFKFYRALLRKEVLIRQAEIKNALKTIGRHTCLPCSSSVSR